MSDMAPVCLRFSTTMSDLVQKTVLDNGLRIVTERILGSRSAAIGAWFAVGSRDETPERSGVSHFLEHLLFKGTEERSSRSVAEAIDGVGGDMNAFTSREYTAFYARVPATAFDMATDLLFDVLRRPALRASDVDAERMVINEELVAAFDTPDDVVHIALYDSLFNGHALAREVLGDPETISAMSSEDIGTFHREWYRPVNLVLSAAGDVEHDRFVEFAAKHFGDLDSGEQPRRAQSPGVPAPGAIGTTLAVEQLHVALGWRSVPHSDPRRFALALANQILGGSPSSRLFQTVREDQGLAYTVFSQTSGYCDAGSATVYAATSAARGAELLAALNEGVSSFATDGVTEHELDLARSGLEGAVVLGLEDSGSRMSRLATGEALRGKVTSLDEFLANVRAVTVEDINKVVGEVYGEEPIVSLVGTEATLDRLASA